MEISNYKIIKEIEKGIFLGEDLNTKESFIIKEILQDTSEEDNEILKREFKELIKQGATIDLTGESPHIKDFFIEKGQKYLVLEYCEEGETPDWLRAFPSLGYIFKNCYVLIHGISDGGFGTVYQVRDGNIPGKYWAIKEMHDSGEDTETMEKNFRREAEILAGLRHQAIPVIVSFFTEQNRHYLVMEYINGQTLEEMIEKMNEDDYLHEKTILVWAIEICEVMEYLHTRPQPVVFRDMKADNIMITPEGELKLIDFGISLIFEENIKEKHTYLSTGYAPREQWLGLAEPRSDIYSFGATLHHLITKIHPKEFTPEFPPPDQFNPNISREMSLVVLKALEPKITNRYASFSEMKLELLKIIQMHMNIKEEQSLIESGRKYEEEEDYFKAISEYMKILEINSGSEQGFYNIARCYKLLGFKNKALEHYRETLKICNSPDIRQKSEEEIKNIERENLIKSLGETCAHMIEGIDLIQATNMEEGSYLSPADFRLLSAFGHSAEVTSICLIPGTQLLASGSKDNLIKIWDLERKILLITLTGHIGYINSICASPDGKWLVSGSDDKTIKLWDIKNKRLSYVFEEFYEEVKLVSFSSDGKKIISSSNNQIYIWDMELKILLYTLEDHKDKITAIALSSDGKFLFSGSSDLTLKIWDLEKRKEIYTFDTYNEAIRSIAVSNKAPLIATNKLNGINIWNIKEKKIITEINNNEKIEFLAFNEDGKRLLSGGRDRILKIWDIETGKLLSSLAGHTGWILTGLWKGNTVISGSSDKTIKLWDSDENKLCHTFGGYSIPVESIDLSPDGKIITSGNADNTIRLWHRDKKILLHSLTGPGGIISTISYSPDGKLLATGSWDEWVYIWDTEEYNVKTKIDITSMISALSFSPDGKYLAIGGSDNSIKLWCVQSQEITKNLESSDWTIEAICFSPDSKWLASGGGNNHITIWDINTEEELETFLGHKDSITAISFNKSESVLISGSKDGTLKIWSIKRKNLFSKNLKIELLHTLEFHTASITCISINSEETLIASGGKDNTINLIDGNSYEIIATFTGHLSSITNLHFTPDGEFIISGSRDGTIKLWDIKKKLLAYTLVAINKEGKEEYISYSPENDYSSSEGGKEYLFFERIK